MSARDLLSFYVSKDTAEVGRRDGPLVLYGISSSIKMYSVQSGGGSPLVIAMPRIADHKHLLREEAQAAAKSSVEVSMWLDDTYLERHA